MNEKTKLKMILLCIVLFYTPLLTIEKNFKRDIDTSLQKAEELDLSEEILDKEILLMNNKLASYAHFLKEEIKYTPRNTEFKKNNEENYIQLKSYSFIPISDFRSSFAGMRYKILRLYFKGDRLSRVETEIKD